MDLLHYLRRFFVPSAPEMTGERWRRVIAIADEALKRPDAAERRQLLADACRGDRALRREVEDLLRYEDAEAPVLEVRGLSEGDRESAGGAPREGASPTIGESFGPYRVEKVLGQGGMGVVVLTTDPELGRRVALKILRREKVSADLLRRFDDERRLLAAEILANAETRIRRDLERDVPPAPFPKSGTRQQEVLAHALEAIGLSHQAHGRWDEARRLLSEALQLRRRVYRGDHSLTARALNNLGALEYEAGRIERAEPLYRLALTMKERLALDEEEVMKVRNNLASILARRGRFDEAERLYRQTLAARLRLYGPDDEDVATSLRSLGILLLTRGDHDAAEPLFRRALEIRERLFGARSTRTAAVLAGLGRVLHAQGRYEEAERALTEALAIREEKLGDGHVLVAGSRRDLALLFFDLGEPATAEILWSRAMAVLRQRGGWEVADAESRLGERLLAEGRRDEALVCLRESWEALRRLRGEDAVVTRAARRRLDSFPEPRSRDLP